MYKEKACSIEQFVCSFDKLYACKLIYNNIDKVNLAWPPGVEIKISTKGVKSEVYTIRLLYPFVSVLNLSLEAIAMKCRLAIEKGAKQFLTFTEK